jgi:hypothetical protein
MQIMRWMGSWQDENKCKAILIKPLGFIAAFRKEKIQLVQKPNITCPKTKYHQTTDTLRISPKRATCDIPKYLQF